VLCRENGPPVTSARLLPSASDTGWGTLANHLLQRGERTENDLSSRTETEVFAGGVFSRSVVPSMGLIRLFIGPEASLPSARASLKAAAVLRPLDTEIDLFCQMFQSPGVRP